MGSNGVSTHEIICNECILVGTTYEVIYKITLPLLKRFAKGRSIAERNKRIANLVVVEVEKIPTRTTYIDMVRNSDDYSTEDAGMSQEQLALELLFGDRSMVSCYENAKRDITITALLAYSDHFNVSTDWILKGKVEYNTYDFDTARMLRAYKGIDDERLKNLAIKQVEAITCL